MRAQRLVRTARRARVALVVPAVGALLVVLASPGVAAATTTSTSTTTTSASTPTTGTASTSATGATTTSTAKSPASTTPTTTTTPDSASTTTTVTARASTTSVPPAPRPTAAAAGGVQTQVFYPTLTVTPSTGLVSGQRVTGTGRGPAATAAECTVQGQCDDSTATSVTPGAAGAFTFHMVVRRFLHVGPTTVDCAKAGRCRIQTQQFGTQPALIEAWASIRFSTTTPSPVTASVVPASGLLDLQLVHVRASGFLPGAILKVEECGAGNVLCTGVNTPTDLVADAHGTLATTANVHRTLSGLNSSYDCTTGSCLVVVSSFDGDAASAPIAFDPAPPPRPPLAVTATPDANLVNHATVALHALGFAPGDALTVEECTVANDAHFGPFCETLAQPSVPTSGVVDRALTVTDSVATIVAGLDQPCGTDQCELVVTSRASPIENVHVRIAFGGPLPPPPPAVTMAVTPTAGLVDRQAVTVSGDNLDPFLTGSLPTLIQCVLGVQQFACTPGPSDASLFPDSAGHYVTTFRVSRVIAGLDGTLYDCADSPGRCALTFDGGPPQVPLTFDPAAPFAPPPAALLSPAGALADRTTVTVHATGFVPGSSVAASECAAFTCDFADQVVGTADPSGGVVLDLQVFRFFDDFVAGRVDCTTGCAVSLDDHTANGARLPLTFDPTLGLATPTPAISVTHASALVGGGGTVVHGVGFGPFTVRLGECPAGATNLDRCDALDEAVTDGSGGFTTTTGTKAVLDTPTGPLDCRKAFGACVYAAWDGHDLFTAPVGFVAGSPTGVVSAAPPPPPAGPTPGPVGGVPVGAGVEVRGATLRTAGGSAAPAASGASDTLPFTGASPGAALRVGLALLVAGLLGLGLGGPRRAGRGRRHRRRSRR